MTELVGIASGVEIGGYRVEELIGRGGMGEVYRAHDGRLDRNVALKILAPRYADDDGFRERLLRESRLAASLDHSNVVPVYDAGEADAGFYLAMRYVEGATCAPCFDVKARWLPPGQSRSSRRSRVRSTPLMRRGSSTATSSRRTY